ncbi:multifunctional tRNA nucleotidy [Legionella wadsworthii]|nr:multifunctional tRNA nucleotidy [Legionella wadsworthii]
MKIYLVGGAVRDKLLGLQPKDNDWVIVGANRDDLLKIGFKPVNGSPEAQNFPVFLHPETNEEYALARAEKRVSQGHGGFEFDTSSGITLLDDLKRRDLTINAMALPFENDQYGELIDPYNGKTDLENQTLRHVSPAFVEDPLRLIRTARFAACFGYKVAPDTMLLMEQMVCEGKISELSCERIWKEMERAMMGTHPANFFEVLNKCGADRILFPYLIISGAGIQGLQLAAVYKNSGPVRFAALMHDLSQGKINHFCKQFNIPNLYRDLAILVNKNWALFKRTPELDAKDLLDFMTQLGAFQNKERFDHCLQVFEACSQESPNIEKIKRAYQAAKSINTKDLAAKYLGHEITRQIRSLRIASIQQSWNDVSKDRTYSSTFL